MEEPLRAHVLNCTFGDLASFYVRRRGNPLVAIYSGPHDIRILHPGSWSNEQRDFQEIFAQDPEPYVCVCFEAHNAQWRPGVMFLSCQGRDGAEAAAWEPTPRSHGLGTRSHGHLRA